MSKENNTKKQSFAERLSTRATKASGSTAAICIAFTLVLIWALLGPVFDYSETWQLVINTSTTIITFLMVFLIQKSQNKESMAVQLKLNELVAAHEYASNRLVDVENLTEDELKVIHDYYCSLRDHAKKEESLQMSHSIEEAENRHEFKKTVKGDILKKINSNPEKKVKSNQA
jgi:low affinity Fe/Cu permease